MNHTSKTKFHFKSLFIFLIMLSAFFNIQTSFAKEYYYQNFEVDIKINQDSTFDVTEKQIYYLDGNFGFFNRDVSLNKIDAITDVEVFDGNNNRISASELDIKSISGAKHIQWNFARRDFAKEKKSWTVKYKAHGGISFLKNYDEIYWNAIPQDRDVAIKNVKVTVRLENDEKFRSDLIQLYAEDIPSPIAGSQLDCEPECANNYKETSRSGLPLAQQGSEHNSEPAENTAYNKLTSIGGYYFNENNTEAIFWGKNIKPNTNFTVAVGFSKGIVSQSAYWKDFFMIYYGFILSIIIFLSCVIIGFVYWYKTEESREGKRAIVPQYEPPQNLRPAMAEVIIKEKLTDKGLAATIIDLAVRGYVRIEEEKKRKLSQYLEVIIPLSLFFIPLLVVFSLLFMFSEGKYGNIIFLILSFFLLVFLIAVIILKSFPQKTNSEYKVFTIKAYKDDLNLENYEKEYLQALFSSGECFSTKELKKDRAKAIILYQEIQKVKDKIYKGIEANNKVFEVGPTKEKIKDFILGALGLILLFIFIELFGELGQFLILLVAVIGSIIALYAFIKYEARLSDSGIKLKEDWLGFKMYLETAEKYRMQNLKPEYFEKYLPYAIIFGIEKKWAKAFETMNIPQPAWYGGNAVVAGHIGSANMVSSFSPSAFSASFASSFSSAFSSSGASGASGGGGGAGGGGGGGGGGAG